MYFGFLEYEHQNYLLFIYNLFIYFDNDHSGTSIMLNRVIITCFTPNIELML